MDPTSEFARCAASPEPNLWRMAVLIASRAREAAGDPPIDASSLDTQLQVLAQQFVESCMRDSGVDRSGDKLVAFMRATGFRGNEAHYYELSNSLVDQVVDRRLGIPISLSVVMIEIGRRSDVPLVGVGLPGEFIVRDRDDTGRFHNPYRGLSFGSEGVDALLRQMGIDSRTMSPELLTPMSTVGIIERMLSNIINLATNEGSRSMMTWALDLQTRLPHTHPDVFRRLAGALINAGRFWDAADALERSVERRLSLGMASDDSTAVAEKDRRVIARLRSGLN